MIINFIKRSFVALLVVNVVIVSIFVYRTPTPTSDEAETTQSKVLIRPSQQAIETTNKTDFMNQQQERIQHKRKRALQEVCGKHPELTAKQVLSKTTTNQLYILDKTKIVYCSIPKAGCSSWKIVFLKLEDNSEVIRGRSVHIPFRKYIFPTSGHVQMKNYTKFVLVRHPFVRLISAYRDKIAQWPTSNRFYSRAVHIAQKYRKEAPRIDLQAKGNMNVTWKEWIMYLTDPSERRHFDSHWRESFKLCSPCHIQYDFIGNLETVDVDSKYMFSVLGLDKEFFPKANAKKVNSDSLLKQYFGDLRREDLNILWDVYKLDFELFGYPKPEILNF